MIRIQHIHDGDKSKFILDTYINVKLTDENIMSAKDELMRIVEEEFNLALEEKLSKGSIPVRKVK